MNILALECGGDFWGISITQIENDVRPLAIAVESDMRSLARELLPRMGSALDDAQITLDEINALTVGIGPGSWTGLRIGLTAMKTLAQVRNLPLAGVPSFDAFAQATWREKEIEEPFMLLVCAPCRAGELYGKIYECGEDSLSVIHSEWIATPQLLADTLSTEALSRGIDAPPVLCGVGLQDVAAIFDARGEEYSRAEPAREHILIELAIAGAVAISSGEASDPMTLAPLYLSPSNAERSLLNR